MNSLPDIRQLQIFLALEETRSFTAAANKLNVTQSAVSHSIKSLESTMNCVLVERLGKKCILTPHGEVFLHHAKIAIKQLEGVSMKIKTLNAWGYTSLKVGVSHSQCQYVLPMALSEFYNTEKRCEVFVTTGDTQDLLNKLDKGELDIAFGIRRNSLENEYQFHSVAKDTLCFITHPEHDWVSNKPLDTEDFEKQRFIIYGNSSVTASVLNTHLSGLGIKYRASIFVNNMESIKAMTALNLGVGIVAEWTAREEIKNKTLVRHPIQANPAREWGYYLSRTKSLSLTEEKFIKTFSSRLKKTINGV